MVCKFTLLNPGITRPFLKRRIRKIMSGLTKISTLWRHLKDNHQEFETVYRIDTDGKTAFSRWRADRHEMQIHCPDPYCERRIIG